MSAHHLSPSHEAKIRALQEKHSKVSEQLEHAQKSPGIADYTLQKLKKEKLTLKDNIELIRAQTTH